MTTLGVVVMAYQNADTIEAAVQSILDQVPTADSLVIVTSGGDRTAALLTDRFPDVALVESPDRLMPGGARNLGIGHLDTEIVAFLAGDCRARSGWIAGRLAAHAYGHDVVASAISTPPSFVGLASHLLKFSHRLETRPAERITWPDAGAHGASYTAAALRTLGGFDEAVRGGEDTFANSRLAAAGHSIWFENSIRTDHSEPTSVRRMLSDQYNRGVRLQRATRTISADRRRLAMLTVWWRTTNPVVRTAWRYGAGIRVRIAAALPLLWLGAAAQVQGRFVESRRTPT